MLVNKYRRGQIWKRVDNAKYNGNIQGKTRPVIIVSNDVGNSLSSVLSVIPLTSKQKSKSSIHVNFMIDTIYNTALCEQLTCVNKFELTEYIGTCDEELMNEIDKAIEITLGLVDTPINPQKQFELTSELSTQDVKELSEKIEQAKEETTTTPHKGRVEKFVFSEDEKIRFVNDFKNHDLDYMIKKYKMSQTTIYRRYNMYKNNKEEK